VAIVTPNEIYGCEEFEQENVSVYDQIEENKYDDLKKQSVYLDVVPDEGEACDKGDKPELPRPRDNVYLQVLSDERSRGSPSPGPSARFDHGNRPATPRLDTTSHDQGGDYEGLKKEEHDDHTYTGMKSAPGERDRYSENQSQEANTEDQSGYIAGHEYIRPYNTKDTAIKHPKN